MKRSRFRFEYGLFWELDAITKLEYVACYVQHVLDINTTLQQICTQSTRDRIARLIKSE